MKQKKSRENWHRNVCRFFGGKPLTWTFCKNMFMVILNSPCRQTPENVLDKKQREKRSAGGPLEEVEEQGAP
jgi:hypothetical protein